MILFKDVKIGFNFYIKNSLGFSRWVKISKTTGSNVDSDVGLYEYNQHKPFLATRQTYSDEEYKTMKNG